MLTPGLLLNMFNCWDGYVLSTDIARRTATKGLLMLKEVFRMRGGSSAQVLSGNAVAAHAPGVVYLNLKSLLRALLRYTLSMTHDSTGQREGKGQARYRGDSSQKGRNRPSVPGDGGQSRLSTLVLHFCRLKQARMAAVRTGDGVVRDSLDHSAQSGFVHGSLTILIGLLRRGTSASFLDAFWVPWSKEACVRSLADGHALVASPTSYAHGTWQMYAAPTSARPDAQLVDQRAAVSSLS
ncbi:hypothetical protein PSPO01_13339 [Paraphaeosphaeria sporulosa]